MKERPILFNGESIRGILEGRKTQTRRVIKPQPRGATPMQGQARGEGMYWHWRDFAVAYEPDSWEERIRCPYGVPSDRLWVRETWTAVDDDYQGSGDTCSNAEILYRADGRTLWRNIPEARRHEWFAKLTPLITRTSRLWRPSIYMPKFAARIWLEITGVRAERLQEITIADAIAEGYEANLRWPNPIDWFRDLWDNLNAKRGHPWSANDWVWVPDFTVET